MLKSGDVVRFVATHLDHTKDPIDRINQGKQLNKMFGNDEIPTILAGDLNSNPESEAMKFLFEKWVPSFPEFEPTHPSDRAQSKMDYILFRPAHKWRVLEKRVICDAIASDHCAVLSVIELLKAYFKWQLV
jgi:endonuclease/exonuclease/phosphatase family metal-dependent hydrolase